MTEKKSGRKNEGGDEVSFESRLKELEGIVARLEKDDVPLEESISLYEKGMELHRACESILDRARLRIEKLSAEGQSGEGAGDR